MSADNYVYVYPGVFCPPTYGHVEILKKACDIFPMVHAICSSNPHKKDVLFNPDECKELWQFYDLPDNCVIQTFENFDFTSVVNKGLIMIRGLRYANELPTEVATVDNAYENNKISNFHYIFCGQGREVISSTAARRFAKEKNLIELAKYVCDEVAQRLLTKYEE